jgi:hypothetical protein
MRPASSRSIAFPITALCLAAALFSLNSSALAQGAAGSKRKLSQQSLSGARPATGAAAVKRTKAIAPPPLTADSWTGTAGDNNWNTAGNWSGGVPTSASAVTIGTATTSVNMNAGTGMFGTLSLSGSGDALGITNGDTLEAFGNIANNGALTLNSTGNFTELVLEGNVTLSGTGTVTLSNNSQNYIFGATSTDQLTNQQTIQGAGQIGHGQMALVNSGTINANASAGMTIDANDGFTNTGLVEASGATLVLQSMSMNNAGGTITATGGGIVNVSSTVVTGGTLTTSGASKLQLNNGTIEGATITNSATGTIEIASGNNGLGGTINNSAGGLLEVDNGANLYLQAGTYSQLGTVQLNSTGNFMSP